MTVLNGLKKSGSIARKMWQTEKMCIVVEGIKKEIEVREKGFTAGSWNKQLLNPDEYEIMVIAQKTIQ